MQSPRKGANYTAAPWQKGITDNFVKIELLLLLGPEWQLSTHWNCQMHQLTLLNPKKISLKSEFYVQANGSQVQ